MARVLAAVSSTSKRCSRCDTTKALENFGVLRRGGFAAWCKECFREHRRESYKLDPQKNINYSRDYRKANPGKVAKQHREWYAAHRDEIAPQNRKRSRKWYSANLSRAAETHRRYYQENRPRFLMEFAKYRAGNAGKIKDFQVQYRQSHKKERRQYDVARLVWDREGIRERNTRRRARKNSAPINDFTREQWAELKRKYNHRCVYCGQSKPLTQDHVTPLSKGGAHTVSNIVPACKSCNCRKGIRKAPPFVVTA